MAVWKVIHVKEETDDYLMERVKKTFLNHHPEMKNIPLSRNYLIYHALKFYVEK